MVKKIQKLTIPVLPLRDVVVYPNMVVPLFVGRTKSIKSLEDAMNNHNKTIMLVTQLSADVNDPVESELYEIGCTATILQLLKLPDGTMKVLVEGLTRARVSKIKDREDILYADCEEINHGKRLSDVQEDALSRALENTFNQYVKLNKKIPPEVLSSIAGIEDLSKLSDSIAAHMTLRIEEKQKVLELFDTKERVEYLISSMESELDVLQVEKKIRGRVKQQMEKSQREYYLNEQMKAIQNELGETDEGVSEFDELAKKIDASGMPKDVKEKAEGELKKLRMMSPMSAEATVVRNYIDWIISVPWKKRSKISKELVEAEALSLIHI